jgi:uncharacterized protein YicC (UPF0701 family)
MSATKKPPTIKSMTGYANAATESPFGRIVVEIKSVNSRFLDLSFRTPDQLRAIEGLAREAITSNVHRGKLECRISFAPTASQDDVIHIDQAALARLAVAIDAVRAQVPHTAPPTASELLRWPGVLRTQPNDEPEAQPQTPDDDSPRWQAQSLQPQSLQPQSLQPPISQPLNLQSAVLTLLVQALADYDASRIREGAQLSRVMLEQLIGMESAISTLRQRVPELIAAQKQRMEDRLREALTAAGPAVPLEETFERVRQEVAALGLRADVAEELDRLGAHIAECHRVISAGGGAGKRLDFLAQEMNREANTIGSKSLALEQTRAAMDLKLLIEQLREQVQNLE